jgi:hypothetical protein
MNRFFAILIVITAAFVFGVSQTPNRTGPFEADLAVAQSAPKTDAGGQPAFVPYPDDNPERLSGLWREGKAVFSDIKLLDMFVPAPYARGHHPEQPIKFSHQLHVEKNQMECQYCHSGVAKASYPTLPSVESCMGCHKLVKTDSPEIIKLKKYYDEGKPVEWVPVHNLPEHAHFPHERHIKAGVGCQNCHGQIQKMQAAERVSSLKMGWCLSCHREKGATIDCSACHY